MGLSPGRGDAPTVTTEQPDVSFWGPGTEGGAVVSTDAATTRQAGAGRRVHVQGRPGRRWAPAPPPPPPPPAPGRLRLASIIVVAVLLLTGLVAALATTERRAATHAVADQATAELVT